MLLIMWKFMRKACQRYQDIFSSVSAFHAIKDGQQSSVSFAHELIVLTVKRISMSVMFSKTDVCYNLQPGDDYVYAETRGLQKNHELSSYPAVLLTYHLIDDPLRSLILFPPLCGIFLLVLTVHSPVY